jgi:hypothetical protein
MKEYNASRRKDSLYKDIQRERAWSYRKTVSGKIANMLAQAKYRSKKYDLEFSLSKEDITIPKICPVLGTIISLNESKPNSPSSPSLDRLDNNKGYTKDNIRVISNRANHVKNDATIEELELVLKYMKGEL